MSMFGGGSMPSLADIAAVTRGNGNGNDGFGGNNGWWVLIILFALFGGWGNDGNGNNRNGNGRGNGGCGDGTTIVMPPAGGGYGMYGVTGSGFMDAAIQRGFDNQAVINKLDGINSGICSLGYDQLAQMNGISNTVMQTGWGIQNSINQLGVTGMQDTFGLQQAINNNTVANMQNTNALTTLITDCCCENRAAVADIKYTMATDACATNNNIHQTGDAIINNQNQGFQMLNNTINDRFTRLEMSQKDQRISELEAQLNRCDRDSALQGMSSYIISNLNPTPRPSYIVQNPNCCSAVPVTVQSQGCGCGGSNFSGCCG